MWPVCPGGVVKKEGEEETWGWGAKVKVKMGAKGDCRIEQRSSFKKTELEI